MDSGSAYVFTRLVTTSTEQNKLTDDDGAAGDSFGCAASLSGDMAVVGAFTDDDMGGEPARPLSSPGYMTAEDTAVDFNVLANDTDVEGDPLTAALVAGPSNGEVTLAPSGDATYTPDPDWSGTDTFTYRASDGDADSNTATATVIVTPVNDAPVAADDSGLMSAVTSAVAGDGAPGDWLGVDVDISGDIAVVGAYGDDDGGALFGLGVRFREERDRLDPAGETRCRGRGGAQLVRQLGRELKATPWLSARDGGQSGGGRGSGVCLHAERFHVDPGGQTRW